MPLTRIGAVLVVVAVGAVVAIALNDVERGSRLPVWMTVASWVFGGCLWGLIAVGAVAMHRHR